MVPRTCAASDVAPTAAAYGLAAGASWGARAGRAAFMGVSLCDESGRLCLPSYFDEAPAPRPPRSSVTVSLSEGRHWWVMGGHVGLVVLTRDRNLAARRNKPLECKTRNRLHLGRGLALLLEAPGKVLIVEDVAAGVVFFKTERKLTPVLRAEAAYERWWPDELV